MTGSNLPPGCSLDSIPGNRPEDAAWERFIDQTATDMDARALRAEEALLVWRMGLAAWDAVRAHDKRERDELTPLQSPRHETLQALWGCYVQGYAHARFHENRDRDGALLGDARSES